MDVVTCLTMADNPLAIRWVDKSKGIWRDKWGAILHLTEETISTVIPPAIIESESDLAKYNPPDSAKAAVLKDATRLVNRFKEICCTQYCSSWLRNYGHHVPFT
jgi:hypothetical protein